MFLMGATQLPQAGPLLIGIGPLLMGTLGQKRRAGKKKEQEYQLQLSCQARMMIRLCVVIMSSDFMILYLMHVVCSQGGSVIDMGRRDMFCNVLSEDP
jgi:hypothetical protein